MADPQQSAPQSRYVEMPNGSYLEWPEGVSADEFKAKAAKVGGAPADATPDTRNDLQKTFDTNTATSPSDSLLQTGLKSLTGAVGAPFVHPIQTAKSFAKAITPDEGGAGIAESALGPAGPMLTHMIGGTGKQAVSDYKEGGLPYAATKMAGNIGGGALLGAAGGGLVAGLDEIPQAARAGEMFNSLNKDLAQHSVPLNATLKPLQRITEIGERGSTLPPAVNKLLLRSQSPIDMTFPEARDYQSSLSDLSATDKMAMGGRVSGSLKQLSKALYTDIQDAAEQAGRGDDYAQAMKEYRQASGLKDSAKAAGKLALKGAGMYGGYTALKDLTGK